MALPVAGLYFDSESHYGDGAESSPMKVVVGVGRSVLQFFVCCFLPPPGHASVFSLLMVSVYFGACNLVLFFTGKTTSLTHNIITISTRL
jgi:hypothetical protein